MNVALRPEASSDLVSAAAYFNDISDGWGDHFLNTIEVDLADLREEAGREEFLWQFLDFLRHQKLTKRTIREERADTAL